MEERLIEYDEPKNKNMKEEAGLIALLKKTLQ